MSWFRVDDAAAFHRKTLAAGNEAFGAWTRMGAHASGQYTDGFIDEAAALLIAGKAKVIARLIEVGFLERAPGGYQIHDYLDYNPRGAEVRARQDAISEARRAAGRVGGQHSGEARRKQVASKQTEANRTTDEANAKQTRSNDEAPTQPNPEETPPDPREAKPRGDAPAERPPTPAERVFAHWCRVMDSPRSRFDAHRRRYVDWALRTYDEETCCRAIDGCRADPFSMGQNDRRKRFNDVSVIFRNAEHVEKFLGYAPADAPPAAAVGVAAPDAATLAANVAAIGAARSRLTRMGAAAQAALALATGTEDDHG